MHQNQDLQFQSNHILMLTFYLLISFVSFVLYEIIILLLIVLVILWSIYLLVKSD